LTQLLLWRPLRQLLPWRRSRRPDPGYPAVLLGRLLQWRLL